MTVVVSSMLAFLLGWGGVYYFVYFVYFCSFLFLSLSLSVSISISISSISSISYHFSRRGGEAKGRFDLGQGRHEEDGQLELLQLPLREQRRPGRVRRVRRGPGWQDEGRPRRCTGILGLGLILSTRPVVLGPMPPRTRRAPCPCVSHADVGACVQRDLFPDSRRQAGGGFKFGTTTAGAGAGGAPAAPIGGFKFGTGMAAKAPADGV